MGVNNFWFSFNLKCCSIFLSFHSTIKYFFWCTIKSWNNRIYFQKLTCNVHQSREWKVLCSSSPCLCPHPAWTSPWPHPSPPDWPVSPARPLSTWYSLPSLFLANYHFLKIIIATLELNSQQKAYFLLHLELCTIFAVDDARCNADGSGKCWTWYKA